jgi:hypothetical protein
MHVFELPLGRAGFRARRLADAAGLAAAQDLGEQRPVDRILERRNPLDLADLGMAARGIGEVEAGQAAHQVEGSPDMAGLDHHAGISRMQPLFPFRHVAPRLSGPVLTGPLSWFHSLTV